MVNRKKKLADSRHPILGKINFTRHLVIRCVERVYDIENKDSSYELRCEACKWLRKGIATGKALKWYKRMNGTVTLTTKLEAAIQVGGFVVILAVDRRGVYTGKTLISVNQCG